MVKKTAVKPKHVPQRTCVGCRETLPKRSLTRVVKTPDGLVIDRTGKSAGRGAYLHNLRKCWEAGMKGALAHALKTDITDQERLTFQAFLENLPAEDGNVE